MPDLEVLHRPAARRRSGIAPLLFVHGAYMGAWCWDEHFMPEFAARGFDCHAVSLRGHGGSSGSDSLDDAGIDDYVEDVRGVAASLPRPPWLVGHSMGAVVVQHVASRFGAAGAVLLTGVPPLGLLSVSFEIGLRAPDLYAQGALVQGGHGRLVDLARLKDALFAPDMSPAQAAAFLGRMGRESRRVFAEMAWPHVCGVRLPMRMPVAVIGGSDDGLFTPATVRASAAWLGVEARILPGLGHAMMLDRRWERAVDCIESWIDTAARGDGPGQS